MITSNNVIDKFKEISRLYGHNRGNMIFEINNDDLDINSIPFEWNITYLSVARANVYCANLKIIVFGKELLIPIFKPTEPVEVLEFEDFFGFESHCGNYNPNKIIAMLPSNVNTEFDIDVILQTENINLEYCSQTLKLLCLGGFIKYWKGLNIFTEWFKKEANIEFKSSKSFNLLLDNFTPILKKDE